MLVRDGNSLTRERERASQDAYEAQLRSWVDKKLETDCYIRVSGNDPRNWERQRGNLVKTEDFEKWLSSRIPSNCVFLPHPRNNSKRFIGQEIAGTLTTVVVYESPVLPEFSLWASFDEEVWDGETKHIDRKDLAGNPNPGFITARQLGHEILRGWRLVLVRLVQEGLLTPTVAESFFGAADRPEWQYALGHAASRVTPW